MSEKPPMDPLADGTRFETLFKDRRDRLFASFTGLVRDRELTEDTATRAFKTAWEKRAQFRGESSLATWLYTISLKHATNGHTVVASGGNEGA